jgi:hypothetical protein
MVWDVYNPLKEGASGSINILLMTSYMAGIRLGAGTQIIPFNFLQQLFNLGSRNWHH